MPELRDKNGVLLKEGMRVSVLFTVAQEMLRGYDLVDITREAPLAGSTADSPQYTVVRFMVHRDEIELVQPVTAKRSRWAEP